jgi:hypothetical protein
LSQFEEKIRNREGLVRVDIARMVAIVSAVIPIFEAILLDLPIVSRFDREMKCDKLIKKGKLNILIF